MSKPRVPPKTVTSRQHVPARTKVATHVPITAGQYDHRGEALCDWCGNLVSHRIHDVTVSSEAEAIDRRRVGEGG